MSIKFMTRIWEHSPQEGAALLMILAIADHANDQGVCWPSVRTLARKCRVSERHATRLISKLQGDGEIEIETGGGRGHTNVYRVMPMTGIGESYMPDYRQRAENVERELEAKIEEAKSALAEIRAMSDG